MIVLTPPNDRSDRALPVHRLQRPRRRGGGFTLVELLVVMAILATLVGIVVVASSSWTTDAQSRDTRLLLAQMESALQQWRSETRLDVFSDDVQAITDPAVKSAAALWDDEWTSTSNLVNSDAAFNNSARWLNALAQSSALRATFAENYELLEEGDDPSFEQLSFETDIGESNTSGLAMPDGFGNPIMLIQVPVQEDTSNVPQWELRALNRFGPAAGRRYKFLSAGPDGRFGDLREAGSNDEQLAADNLSNVSGVIGSN